jgi:hypothetical protein
MTEKPSVFLYARVESMAKNNKPMKIKTFKIICWCVVFAMYFGYCGTVELADKLACGMHP